MTLDVSVLPLTVTKAVIRAAGLLGLDNDTLAAVLGTSESTVSEMASGTCLLDPQSKAYELSLLVIRLFVGLEAMVGEPEVMRSWMNSNNRTLFGIPYRKIRTINGMMDTVNYVEASGARI